MLIVCSSNEKWCQPRSTAALSVDAQLAPLKRAHIFLMQYSMRRFLYGAEGGNVVSVINKEWKPAAALPCFMETNHFANSNAWKNNVELSLNGCRWDAHIVEFLFLMDLLRKNTEGKKIYVCGICVIFQTELQLEQQEHQQMQGVLCGRVKIEFWHEKPPVYNLLTLILYGSITVQ